jgi:ABC-type polysaccharide/polyol phosphate transport system ATPase subunit
MTALNIQGLWKGYRIYYEKILLKELFWNLPLKKYKEYFWALKDISFSIDKGETLGIIGRNGSGKTTLLRCLCGISKPTKGSIHSCGKTVGLLELGAGFQPDLTGRENIYLNGLLLGLNKSQISSCLNSIIEFADIGKFINAPLRTYSAGMYLRLGFAIAVQVDPDILLIDEVLAVGDEAFQEKCFDKIREFRKKNKTIIIVSHNMNAIDKLCYKAIFLKNGQIYKQGATHKVIRCYQNMLAGITEEEEIGREVEPEWSWGSGEAKITGVDFISKEKESRAVFNTGEGMVIKIKYLVNKRIEKPVFGIAIYRDDGAHIIGPNTKMNNFNIDSIAEGEGAIEFKMESIPLLAGNYEVTAAIHTEDGCTMFDHQHRIWKFQIRGGEAKYNKWLIFIPHHWRMA